ncbi:60S ribosomal protein L18a-like protein isoform X2 [Selaginella moellendorffii]|uniref:60S ribosomal protein L18a-like protein isoform X2 n=1 Tax=Selaginella moellendorffii TaxID=88036 RepID=UPI000D1C87F2|nr:60S ribosomal protein L18a-like protein isoform X2 [Selaginella moellendorffii]|eukprot:XP_024541999.1 60S ribosomal protein L18a-like protein isoform X2 [Selaginella moellendorffii]
MTDSYHLLRGRGDGDWDEPLPCCGCGVGWCSFLLGFIVPLFWYYGTFVFFFPRFQRDLRERPGFAACAIAALVFTVGLVILVIVLATS